MFIVKNKMSPTLASFTYLRSVGLIEKADEARYLGCFEGDHVLGLACGKIVAIDLITGTHRLNGAAL